MTTKQNGWISRRGQANAAAAVELVLERQLQETVQQIADELIEDSPYQARQPISDESVEELAQGMRSAGFQGVLIVRPHADVAKRRQGLFQLVYGHRRRVAWRHVCQEQNEPCVLPVVVRTIGDVEMLTIGAQENLQRQDLDPLEESQVVAMLEHAFPTKSQNDIGSLIGKSSDWISLRSRIHRLPDVLKTYLRERPRAIAHILEIGALFERDPQLAIEYAERIIHENLTLNGVRALIRGYSRPPHQHDSIREEKNNRRGAATSVQNITTERQDPVIENAPLSITKPESPDRETALPPPAHARQSSTTMPVIPDATLIRLLEEAASALRLIAQQREYLPYEQRTIAILSRIQQDLTSIQELMPDRIDALQFNVTEQ